MREGVARDGSHLFGAFPYWAYTKLYDDDVQALYAYLMTRPPVSATTPPNNGSVSSQHPGRSRRVGRFCSSGVDGIGSIRQRAPNGIAEPIWLRRSAIARAVIRPAMHSAAKKASKALGGAVIDHWIAPALTEANPSPVPWTQEELFGYLRTGVTPLHGANRRHNDSGRSAMPWPFRWSRVAMFAPLRCTLAISIT